MHKDEFIINFLKIIRNCNYDNTYKMAWAKAIVEIAVDLSETENNDNSIQISLEEIAEKVLKYYWNQTIYFDLIQGSNPLKPPKILSLTKSIIETYKNHIGSYQPVRFERVQHVFCRHINLITDYNKIIKGIILALKADVSYRFLNLEGKTIDGIYSYTQGDNSLFIDYVNIKKLIENAQYLFETINYRWALILETFNSTPRICKKVKIIDENEIPRKPLKKFMKYLDIDNPQHICFLCGEKIDKKSLSIDHVIPWSYLYSDDLWNLVYSHKGCNSIKNSIIPEEKIIRKLEERNQRLLTQVNPIIKDKSVEELKLAIEKNYVYKFWISCQG